jgi:hypothetical protein
VTLDPTSKAPLAGPFPGLQLPPSASLLTKPDLGHVKRDLLSVLHAQHGALRHVDRVDRLVFPLLALPKHSLYLAEPPLSESHTV